MRRFARIALVAMSAACLACGPEGRNQAVSAPAAPRASEPPSSVPPVDVTTVRIARGSIHPRISAPASLMARRESRIGGEVRGRIQKVFVREGDRVQAGDPLFQIEPETYEVALRQAEAGLDLARSERRQIQADLRRLGALHSKDVVAVDELDRVKTRVAVAKARERQAKASVAMARRNLEQTLVSAPFDGSVAERRVDEGTTALVQPQTIVIVLQETAVLEAVANLPESQLADVHVGDPAQVHVEGLGEPIVTEITSVSDTVDPTTRTYRVDMLVPNPDHRLKAGTFAHVEIEPRAKREVVLVPRDAVRTEDGRTRVLIVEDGRARAIAVRLGIVAGSHAEVVGGLPVDSEVIVGSAAQEIAPGMLVRVVPSDAKPTS